MPFCSLPSEVRNIIYSSCLVRGTRKHPLIVRRRMGYSRALLQVSRAIRSECLPMYWSQNNFHSASLSTREVASWIHSIGIEAARWLGQFYFLTDITALNFTFVQLRLRTVDHVHILEISGMPHTDDLLHCSKCWCGQQSPCLWNQQGPYIRLISQTIGATPTLTELVDRDALTNIFEDNWSPKPVCQSLARAVESCGCK